MVEVTKWDGRREPFQREKVERTLLRLGAPPRLAERLSRKIEDEAYEGIPTKEVLDRVYQALEEYKPAVALRKDLRTALGEMRSAPDFEEYVRIVLRAQGYRVHPNRIIQGLCVTHEVDGIAEKDGERIYLEVKHHRDPHNYTPFEGTLSAKAKLDDIREGLKRGLNNEPFDRVLIVCNTRLTEHARRYADCIGIDHMGWNVPHGRGFERLIEEKRLYPVTILRSPTEEEKGKLSEHGILTLEQLISRMERVNIPESRMSELIDETKRILEQR